MKIILEVPHEAINVSTYDPDPATPLAGIVPKDHIF